MASFDQSLAYVQRNYDVCLAVPVDIFAGFSTNVCAHLDQFLRTCARVIAKVGKLARVWLRVGRFRLRITSVYELHMFWLWKTRGHSNNLPLKIRFCPRGHRSSSSVATPLGGLATAINKVTLFERSHTFCFLSHTHLSITAFFHQVHFRFVLGSELLCLDSTSLPFL